MSLSEELKILEEIRDYLKLIAEPQLEARDKRHRDKIREIVGKGEKKQNAVLLMDGTKTRPEICEQAGIDNGNLSRLITAMKEYKLLQEGDVKPCLVCPLPRTFFGEEANG